MLRIRLRLLGDLKVSAVSYGPRAYSSVNLAVNRIYNPYSSLVLVVDRTGPIRLLLANRNGSNEQANTNHRRTWNERVELPKKSMLGRVWRRIEQS